MVVKQITRFSLDALRGMNMLLRQWSDSGYQVKAGYFKILIKKSHVFLLYDGKKIIGTVTLIPLHKLSGLKGSIEHLLIDEKYRGQGLGKKLMQHALSQAKKLKMQSLFLTCEPHRQAANVLYKKLGFIQKDTYFYEKRL